MDIDETVYTAPKTADELKLWVDQYLSATAKNAIKVNQDRDYFDGHQLSSAVRAELEKRGQPLIYTNKISSAMNGLFGIIDAGDTDPECQPRTPNSQDAADVATKTLRYLTERAKYKSKRRMMSETYLIQGIGAGITQWANGSVTIDRIRWEDFVYDPLSREHDFTDAKFLGIAKLLDAADVAATYPETYAKLDKPTGDFGSFFDDDSKSKWWSSSRRDRLRVIDLYYLIGDEWHRTVFCDAGALWEGPSDYHDDMGVSMCPISAMSYEVDRRGDRYGSIRHMIPLQNEINARRSRLLHLTNHRQVKQTDMYAPAENKNIAVREAAKADGAIPFGWDPISAPDLAQGQMLILQESTKELDRMAPTPAVLGRLSGEQSGRSRQILQQAGYTELARAFGRYEDLEKTIFTKAWCIAREYLDQPTMIRIADDPRAIEFLQINEPVMGPVQQPVMDPTGQPMIDPTTGQPAMQVTMGVVGQKNRLATLDMDIIVTTVPSSSTLEQEVFEKIMDTAASLSISPLDPQFDALIEFMPLANKRATQERLQRIREKASQSGAEQQQAQAQQADAAQQLQAAALQAKTAKDAAHASKAGEEAQQIALENRHIIDRSVMNQAFGNLYQTGLPLQ